MSYTIDHARPSRAAMTISGEMDLGGVAELLPALRQALAAGITHASLDLSGVTFMDCTGLGAVLGWARGLQAAGGSLRVIATSPRVETITRLTRTPLPSSAAGCA